MQLSAPLYRTYSGQTVPNALDFSSSAAHFVPNAKSLDRRQRLTCLDVSAVSEAD